MENKNLRVCRYLKSISKKLPQFHLEVKGNWIAKMDRMNMTYSGRIYLDPRNMKDIYINIGWMNKDKQMYPPYEQWLAPYVTQEKYQVGRSK